MPGTGTWQLRQDSKLAPMTMKKSADDRQALRPAKARGEEIQRSGQLLNPQN